MPSKTRRPSSPLVEALVDEVAQEPSALRDAEGDGVADRSGRPGSRGAASLRRIGHHVARGGEADAEDLRPGRVVGELDRSYRACGLVPSGRRRNSRSPTKVPGIAEGSCGGASASRRRTVRLRASLVGARRLEGQEEGRFGRPARFTDELVPDPSRRSACHRAWATGTSMAMPPCRRWASASQPDHTMVSPRRRTRAGAGIRERFADR